MAHPGFTEPVSFVSGRSTLPVFMANNQMLYQYGNSTFNPRIAVNAYNVIALFQFALLMLIVPALQLRQSAGRGKGRRWI